MARLARRRGHRARFWLCRSESRCRDFRREESHVSVAQFSGQAMKSNHGRPPPDDVPAIAGADPARDSELSSDVPRERRTSQLYYYRRGGGDEGISPFK